MEKHHSVTNYAFNDPQAKNPAPLLASQTCYEAKCGLVNIKVTNTNASVVGNTFTTAKDTKPSAASNPVLR